jgi:hypothetical protein
MMQQMSRIQMHARLVTPFAKVLAVMSLASGCYEYKPVVTETIPVGENVALQITDRGRVDLADRFGPGVSEIQGRIVSAQDNDVTMNVFRVSQLDGESVAWAGEVTHLNRVLVGVVKTRQFSLLRSGLFAATAGVAAYFLASHALNGGFSGPTGDPPSTGSPPVSVRIPFAFRF